MRIHGTLAAINRAKCSIHLVVYASAHHTKTRVWFGVFWISNLDLPENSKREVQNSVNGAVANISHLVIFTNLSRKDW